MLPSERATEIVKERQGQYGHPAPIYLRAAKMWSAILNIEVRVLDVALCMAALKIAREVETPLRDNVDDIAGYANVYAMIQEYYDHPLTESG